MSTLFSPLKLRNIEFKSRVFVSPMCQYSSESGMPGDWHLVHLGSRAVGGPLWFLPKPRRFPPKGELPPGTWEYGVTLMHGRSRE